MKNYFNEDVKDWLDGLLPDLIDELLQPTMDPGLIYAPYIPLQVTPSVVDPSVFEGLPRPYKTGKVISDFYSTGRIGDLAASSSYPAPKRRVAAFERILGAVESFAEKRPAEVPTTGTVKRLQLALSLKRLTAAGILRYDAEQHGWWRPEVLDALAAISDASQV
jgi:hypothetical protein